jgi:hypothetical protein
LGHRHDGLNLHHPNGRFGIRRRREDGRACPPSVLVRVVLFLTRLVDVRVGVRHVAVAVLVLVLGVLVLV